MLQKCPAEDDGSVEYAATKVSAGPNARRSRTRVCFTPSAPSPPSGFVLQIHQYLITKTAKDCSIMVALVPSTDKEEEDEG